MYIENSTVQLSASHEASRSTTLERDTIFSFKNMFDQLAATQESDQVTTRQERIQNLLQSLIDAIMAAMDGRSCEENIAADNAAPAASASTGRGREISWQSTITQHVSESEKTNVCGKGCVTTADGRQIDFDYSLALAREYQHESSLSESGSIALKDPLVLNFDGKSCELTEDRIDFDLDSDGKAEQIPGLGKGSCFLVFDRNGNGRADNGSELFGVTSGKGFSDLARLDDDGNGWIDEGDAAFSQLALWSSDGFVSLKEGGVGALYTSAVDAPFSLKTRSNELLGQITAAGLYLSESGKVGHLQQVDLAVSDAAARGDQPEEGQQLGAREQQEGGPESA